MAPRVDVEPRKIPRQERSRRMDRLILEAAARVLERDGPAGFNTNRVAERAGISVGSLYQYYPNKAALLLQLQRLESVDTSAAIAELLRDTASSPRERLYGAVRAFFASEAAEAPLRGALSQARTYFRGSREFNAVERGAVEQVRAFLRSAQPGRPGRRDFDAQVIVTLVTSVSETVTERGVRGRELRRWADSCAAMLCRHLEL